MVEIGSILRARVTRVEPYGIFLEHPEGPVCVLVPEVSWSAKGDLRERVRRGEAYDVLVLRYNYRDQIIVGSIKRLHPEENPYRQLSRLEPGQVFQAKVLHNAGSEMTVELPNGAWGQVPLRLVPTELNAQDTMDVVITSLEVDEGQLWLEPAPREARALNGPVVSGPAVVTK